MISLFGFAMRSLFGANSIEHATFAYPTAMGQLTRVGDRFAELFDPLEVLRDRTQQLKILLAEVDICLPSYFTIGQEEPF